LPIFDWRRTANPAAVNQAQVIFGAMEKPNPEEVSLIQTR
jgi:hypothetical protein